jgi:hypothetical protein
VNSPETHLQDERLRELAIAARGHPDRSRERRKALTRLVQEILNSGRLCRPRQGQFVDRYEEIYQIAVQNLMLYVCGQIDRYKPESGPVMRWVNFLLEKRFFVDAIAEVMGKKTAIKTVEINEEVTVENSRESNPSLSELVRQYIEEDPEGRFEQKHIRGHPEANFKVLVKRRMAGDSWEQISTDLGVKISTLSDFYQRCLKQFSEQIKGDVQI